MTHCLSVALANPACVCWILFFFYSRWFWIQVDFLNPCKCGHIKACKCAHTPTRARTHNRSPPTRLPLTGKCHCGVQLMRWIQCTLLTVISCLLREETVMTGMKVQVCEHGGKAGERWFAITHCVAGRIRKQKSGGRTCQTTQRGGTKKRCGADFKIGVINFQQRRGFVPSERDMDALSHPDNRRSV